MPGARKARTSPEKRGIACHSRRTCFRWKPSAQNPVSPLSGEAARPQVDHFLMGRNQLPSPRSLACTAQHLVAGEATACPSEPTSGDRERKGGDRKEGGHWEGEREGEGGTANENKNQRQRLFRISDFLTFQLTSNQ